MGIADAGADMTPQSAAPATKLIERAFTGHLPIVGARPVQAHQPGPAWMVAIFWIGRKPRCEMSMAPAPEPTTAAPNDGERMHDANGNARPAARRWAPLKSKIHPPHRSWRNPESRSTALDRT